MGRKVLVESWEQDMCYVNVSKAVLGGPTEKVAHKQKPSGEEESEPTLWFPQEVQRPRGRQTTVAWEFYSEHLFDAS